MLAKPLGAISRLLQGLITREEAMKDRHADD